MDNSVFRASYATVLMTSVASIASAQETAGNYGVFGTVGLLEMPVAQSAPVHEFATSFAYTPDLSMNTFTFQATDRFSASFRFAFADLYDAVPTDGVSGTFERGFDLQYRLSNETAYLPAVAIGMRDFLSPGRFGAEYVVATKTFGDDLAMTTGIGWGAMGTRDGFANPLGGIDPSLDVRPVFDETDPGGRLASDQWFRGDAALFGGVSYQISDRWGVQAEYSSSAYPEDPFAVALPVTSPFNFGVSYSPAPEYIIALSYLYGTQIGLSGTVLLNPENRPSMSGGDLAPVPVRVRPADARAAASWDRAALPEAALRDALTSLLAIEGITLTGLEMTDITARVRYENKRFRSEAQAMGRVARMMSQVMPASVDTFILEPEREGIPLSSVTIPRQDLEQLENRPGATEAMLAQVQFDDAGPNDTLTAIESDERRWGWGVGPYVSVSKFDSDGGVRADIGLNLRGRYDIRPNLVVTGTIRQSLLGAEPVGGSVDTTPDYQNVRTDEYRYGRDGVPVLRDLTLTHYGRPARNVYSRVSLGYLEKMFGGVSGELLWKPVESRLGLGVEVNAVAQRNADMGFGFDEYNYDVVTGHISAYYNIGRGYHAQVDAGRYLAGDWGATLVIDREFANGWKVGTYVTRTDMSFANYGDGSYDKGVRVSVPIDFFASSPSQRSVSPTFSTGTQDGGARVEIDGRLYDVVRDAHAGDLTDSWGRFWR